AMLHTTILSYNDGKCFAADAGTKDGTLVNGRCLIGGQIQLMDGDEITVGPLVFRFSSLDANQMPRANDTVAMTPAVRPEASLPLPPKNQPQPPPYLRQDSALSEQPPAYLTESNIFVVSRKDDALDLETLPDFDLDRKDPNFLDKPADKQSKN
ncbi:MAG TPA: FHA domain-containing protein, partial [Gemmatales bacterium]|nr:FHA domain-containing protein [Gemmatales bacterium]